MKIPAKHDGKIYSVLDVKQDKDGSYLQIMNGTLDDMSPYVVIDGKVFHARLHRKCENCYERYWLPLNETLEEFTHGWRVVDLRRIRS